MQDEAKEKEEEVAREEAKVKGEAEKKAKKGKKKKTAKEERDENALEEKEKKGGEEQDKKDKEEKRAKRAKKKKPKLTYVPGLIAVDTFSKYCSIVILTGGKTTVSVATGLFEALTNMGATKTATTYRKLSTATTNQR